ncbi:hypothetical protein BEWA_026860 [Theileria equi strain WA]|uniref:Uncharacterized protein n=1 Tax=Theileria equi strain WA TaxID=1537102 RepID=L0AW63_THEEQ|nr:hypothetical protein BEWA_026860 [Theileria equi strain WA]AFZ79837.1 hypothetical protein BEWA_026860 [Theileria equi strain WA]|eukprot:XP_004829503.1 hypothetical protein BEWA_026860 [Theileria equi strain WA]
MLVFKYVIIKDKIDQKKFADSLLKFYEHAVITLDAREIKYMHNQVVNMKSTIISSLFVIAISVAHGGSVLSRPSHSLDKISDGKPFNEASTSGEKGLGAGETKSLRSYKRKIEPLSKGVSKALKKTGMLEKLVDTDAVKEIDESDSKEIDTEIQEPELKTGDIPGITERVAHINASVAKSSGTGANKKKVIREITPGLVKDRIAKFESRNHATHASPKRGAPKRVHFKSESETPPEAASIVAPRTAVAGKADGGSGSESEDKPKDVTKTAPKVTDPVTGSGEAKGESSTPEDKDKVQTDEGVTEVKKDVSAVKSPEPAGGEAPAPSPSSTPEAKVSSEDTAGTSPKAEPELPEPEKPEEPSTNKESKDEHPKPTKPKKQVSTDELSECKKKALELSREAGDGVDALKEAQAKIRKYVRESEKLVRRAKSTRATKLLDTAKELRAAFYKKFEKTYPGLAEIHSTSLAISNRLGRFEKKKNAGVLKYEVTSATKTLKKFDSRLQGSLKDTRDYTKVMIAKVKAVTDKIKSACKADSGVKVEDEQVEKEASSPKTAKVQKVKPQEKEAEVQKRKLEPATRESVELPNTPSELQKKLRQDISDATENIKKRKGLAEEVKNEIKQLKELDTNSDKSFDKEIERLTELKKKVNESILKTFPKVGRIYRNSDRLIADMDGKSSEKNDELVKKVKEATKDDQTSLKELEEEYNELADNFKGIKDTAELSR